MQCHAHRVKTLCGHSKIGLYLIKRFRNEILQIAIKSGRFIKGPKIEEFNTGKFTLIKKKFS
jgi:hypothetical protein